MLARFPLGFAFQGKYEFLYQNMASENAKAVAQEVISKLRGLPLYPLDVSEQFGWFAEARRIRETGTETELLALISEIDRIISGLQPRVRERKLNINQGYVDTETRKQRKQITGKTRFFILSRDGFRCVLCGRNPIEDDVKLHVDHIVPFSKGGLTEIENLRTLCAECNLGKSNT